MMALAVLVGLGCGLVLGTVIGWHGRTWPLPTDSQSRREHAEALDALDRIGQRRSASP